MCGYGGHARSAGLFANFAKHAIVHGPVHVRDAREKRKNVGSLCCWALQAARSRPETVQFGSLLGLAATKWASFWVENWARFGPTKMLNINENKT